MATVPTKTFSQLVSGAVAAVQASASGLVDFSIGSINRAIQEAIAATVLWLQGLILALLVTTRAATSTGVDLDSWMADFGLTRLAATHSTGLLTFSRFSTTSQVVVPVGATVSTLDGTQSFVVTLNASHPNYNGGLGGYVMAIGTGSVANIPAQAVVAGAAGNAAPSTVSLITSTITGVDSVNNPTAFVGGSDQETDAAFRARFTLTLQSLSKGNKSAVLAAVLALGPTVQAVVVENQTYAGAFQPGFFYVVADDGSGSPPGSFLTSVQNAVEAIRSLTVTFQVYGPTLNSIPLAITVGINAGYDATATRAAVQTAITNFINGLGMGVGLVYNRLIQIAYDASPGVATVTALTVNGGTSDIAANSQQTIKPLSVTVT